MAPEIAIFFGEPISGSRKLDLSVLVRTDPHAKVTSRLLHRWLTKREASVPGGVRL
jgi:hypothetical protein